MKNKLLFSITTLLSASSLINAQAPSLGAAAEFVIFTSNGAVTNTGISHLTGNVGTNSGSSTAFGNVNGGMHDNDGITAAAATDLLTAYNNLNTMTPAFFPAPLLGNGTSLTAGVYSITGNTTLNDTLKLNAAGNPNALFVFKIQGTFSASAYSYIKLVGGTQACNIFWKVEGMVSIATGAVIRGNVVANNAAIAISSGAELEGRALSTTGGISVDNVLMYLPTGCGSVSLTGPAAPALGATACYAILSGNGPVMNNGVSSITGDVGTNAGLTTGYDPLTVDGTIHSIPDGSTAAATADLLDVHSYLNTLPADIELLYPAQFGNSLVLTPHTYILNGATTFTDTLFLNGTGNVNAIFVIRINGALQTSTYSNVVLMNGTQAKNVYWCVNGSADISDYSEFNGTLVVNNGAVNLYSNAVLNGRAFTTTGAVTTTAVTVAIPEACSISVGLNDSRSAVKAEIYPNPFSDRITISVDQSQIVTPVLFRLYDATGHDLINIRLVNPVTTLEPNIQPGTYFYSIIGENGFYVSGKLIRQ
jgi:hypothetical protein